MQRKNGFLGIVVIHPQDEVMDEGALVCFGDRTQGRQHAVEVREDYGCSGDERMAKPLRRAGQTSSHRGAGW